MRSIHDKRSAMPSSSGTARTTRASLREYGRGVAGGLLFSIPLLFTMEMWWTSFIASPFRLLVALGATFVLLLAYNRFAGMRRDANFGEVVVDSVEELGIGVVVAAFILLLLDRVGPELPLQENVSKIVLQAFVVAIGVSVGTAQLGEGEEDERGLEGSPPEGFVAQGALAACGAVVIAANLAPTEEILLLASQATAWHFLGIFATSLTLVVLILVGSGMRGKKSPLVGIQGSLGHAASSSLTYSIALGMSALLLWFFGRFDGVAPVVALGQIIVLGLPAALGASAGRLLLQS